jgi:hypothetical protein
MAVVAALVGVACAVPSAEACHKRRGCGRSACAGGGYGGGCGGYGSGGYAMGGCGGGYGGYATGGYGEAYPGMASYATPQSGGYGGMVSYPNTTYGTPVAATPYHQGMTMPAAGSYSSGYGTAPGGYVTSVPAGATAAPPIPTAPR